MSAGIVGSPVASGPCKYCEWCAIDPATFSQADLNAVVGEGLRRSPLSAKFDQVLHLGSEGLAILSLSGKGALLRVRRDDIVRFGVGGESSDRQALVVMVGNGTGAFAAHVVDMEGNAAELMAEAGETVLQRLWRTTTPPMTIPPGARGGQYRPIRQRLVDVSSRAETDEAVLLLRPEIGASFGFMFSTNTTDLLDGVNHYVSSVDANSAAAAAGMRPGDRILSINRTDCRNLPHGVVVSMVRAATESGGPATLEIIVAGPNQIIRNSMRQKSGKLQLHRGVPAVVQLGVGQDFAPAQDVGANEWNGTEIELADPGGVPESELGSLSSDILPTFIFTFSAEFTVPDSLSAFDLFAPGRDIVDAAMFRCRGKRAMTVAVVICTDVVIVAEVVRSEHGERQYVLVCEPSRRSAVAVTASDEDSCALNLQLEARAFTLRAPTPEERNEWAQILENPAYTGPAKPDEVEISSERVRSGSPHGRRGKPPSKRPKGKKAPPKKRQVARVQTPDPELEEELEGGREEATPSTDYYDGEEASEEHDLEEHHDSEDEQESEEPEGIPGVTLHSVMTLDETNDLVEDYGKSEGVFLFRAHTNEDEVVLTVVYKNKVTHHKLAMEGGAWVLKRKGGATDLDSATTLDEVRDFLSVQRDFWPAPLTSQILPAPGREHRDDDSAGEPEAEPEPVIPQKVTVRGRSGITSYVNGDYVMDFMNEAISSPVYRHKESEVYTGPLDAESPTAIYLWYSEANLAWAIGPEVGGNEVIGFCPNSNFSADMPPNGSATWRFLHRLRDAAEDDHDISIEHSEGVDSTPM